MAELDLMTMLIKDFKHISVKQVESPGKYLRKRTPQDSEIDISKSIEKQFNKLRVVDLKIYIFIRYA